MLGSPPPHTSLSEEIQREGIEVLHALLSLCEEFKVEEASAIATEVFRRASNGADFLKRVHLELGLEVHIICQEEEAKLGHATGLAMWKEASKRMRIEEEDTVLSSNNGKAGGVVVWDSGGGSFQITAIMDGMKEEEEVVVVKEEDGSGMSCLHTYVGSIGSIGSYRLLWERVRWKAAPNSKEPVTNPVTILETQLLITAIITELKGHPPPDWLQHVKGSRTILGIGGPNSIFQLAAKVLHRELDGCFLSVEDVTNAIELCINKSDAELVSMVGDYPLADPFSLLLPKLCLLLAVMQHTSIHSVCPLSVVGSCAGLLVSESYWISRRY